MQKLLLAIGATVVALLSSCTTTGCAKLDDVNCYLKLREHESTKADVYGVFGQPHDLRTPDAADNTGDVVWVYYKIHRRPSGSTFIPYAGMLAGGSHRELTFAYFDFDESGTLQKIVTKTDTDYENMWAGAGRGISRASEKTQAERVHEEMDKLGRPFDDKIAKSVAAERDE